MSRTFSIGAIMVAVACSISPGSVQHSRAELDPCAAVADRFVAEAAKAGQKDFKIDSVRQSQVKGLCEIQSGTSVLYYAPAENLIVSGNIFAFDGRNYTKERMDTLTNETLGRSLAKLPLDKAVTVGKGAVQVIEITDPDCPYCRKASAWLDGRSDVTRKVFFAPLAHPKAIDKVKAILAARDQEAAYHAYMRGDHDKDADLPKITDEKATALAGEHLKIATAAKVNGTPTFFVNGKVVIGADIEAIKRAIEQGS